MLALSTFALSPAILHARGAIKSDPSLPGALLNLGAAAYTPFDSQNRANYGHGSGLCLGVSKLAQPGTWIDLTLSRTNSSGPTPVFDSTFQFGPSSYQIYLVQFGPRWNLLNRHSFDRFWIHLGFGADMTWIHLHTATDGASVHFRAGAYMELEPSIPLGSRWRLWARDRALVTGSLTNGPAARYNYSGQVFSLGASWAWFGDGSRPSGGAR